MESASDADATAGVEVPKGLQGKDWLFEQSARSELRREIASSSASRNPEFHRWQMRGVGERTMTQPSAAGAEDWQVEMRDNSHVSMKAMNFSPARLMFHCAGRPCVVPCELFLRG